MRNKSTLCGKYPMLRTQVAQMSDYVGPDDYDRLLKRYTFSGKTDLQMLEEFLRNSLGIAQGTRGHIGSILEFGCGTGRATDVVLNVVEADECSLLDLSSQMIDHTRKKYTGRAEVRFVQQDAIEHIEKSNLAHDFIYSMWSFSHSVHQVLDTHAFLHDVFRVQDAIRRMIDVMMKPGARFYMMHVDSLSDEQRMLFRQWAKAFPMFGDTQHQSPSKLLIDDILRELERSGVIGDLQIRPHDGESIEYASLEEALDVFLNFHLESFFNQRPDAEEVADELAAELSRFQKPNGKIAVNPGCITYQFRKSPS